MLIPATSVTSRHEIRMRVGGRDTGWLDVEHVTTPASYAAAAVE